MNKFLASVKNDLAGHRKAIRARHLDGMSGVCEVEEITAMMDAQIHRIHAHVLGNIKSRMPEYCLLGLGGYGRRQLCLGSDIDIMFLYHRNTKPAQELFSGILHILWDLGFEVGHSYRSIKECIHIIKGDLITATALMESRMLLGDVNLYAQFELKVKQWYLQHYARTFLDAKTREVSRRHHDHENSCFLREPDIKNGVGGLRDIQTVMWLRSATPLKLKRWRIDLPLAHDILVKELDFLLRLRCEMHYITNKKTDRLAFDMQTEVVQAMTRGQIRNRKAAVEKYMQEYYKVAKEVYRQTRLELARFQWHTNWKKVKRRSISHNLVAMKQVLYFAKSPGADSGYSPTGDELISIFLEAQRRHFTPSEQMLAGIRQHILHHQNARSFTSTGRKRFLEFLQGGRVYPLLMNMHDANLLTALLPALDVITCCTEHDSYHAYTMDIHTLLLIKEIEDLENPHQEIPRPVLQAILRRGIPRHVFYLAVLFHDVGKPHGPNHSASGSKIAAASLQDFPLSREERDTICFLIHEHLTMAKLAQRRDFNEPHVLEEFANLTETLERLELLYLLTYADTRAVSPHLWTEWKGALLGELFQKTATLFTHDKVHAPDTSTIVHTIKSRLCGMADSAEAAAFVSSLPESYLERVAVDDMLKHYRLLREASRAAIAVHIEPMATSTAVTVATDNKPGLLAKMISAFVGNDLLLHGLDAYSLENGKVLDVFQITDGKSRPLKSRETIRRLVGDLTGLASGDLSPEALIARGTKKISYGRTLQPAYPPPDRIHIDHRASRKYTVVEIFARHHIGGIYRSCLAVSTAGLDIHFARISVDVDQQLAVFYVTKQQSREKIQDPAAIAALKAHLSSLRRGVHDPSGGETAEHDPGIGAGED